MINNVKLAWHYHDDRLTTRESIYEYIYAKHLLNDLVLKQSFHNLGSYISTCKEHLLNATDHRHRLPATSPCTYNLLHVTTVSNREQPKSVLNPCKKHLLLVIVYWIEHSLANKSKNYHKDPRVLT